MTQAELLYRKWNAITLFQEISILRVYKSVAMETHGGNDGRGHVLSPVIKERLHSPRYDGAISMALLLNSLDLLG